MTIEQESIILAEVVEIAGRKKLACLKAFALAEKLGISVKEIGEFCERNGIKIFACQLGCF